MPSFLLLPYVKKILSSYEYFTNISCHQLPPAPLVISEISIVRILRALTHFVSSEQYGKQRQIYYKKLMGKSDAVSDTGLA